ncbi:YcaO-like family protein [Streptomyces sp. NPDC058297]|uniref:YcaO-like family protein n=1 Tax=unclassified Streptomyces TaxID=2593676 RepID=UPI0036E61732
MEYLTYVRVVAVDAESSVVTTASRRSFRVPLGRDRTIELIRSLEQPVRTLAEPEGDAALLDQLRNLLEQGGSLARMGGHRLHAAEKIFVTGERELCESVLDAGRLGLTYVEAGRFLSDHSEHSLCEGPVLVVAAGTDAPLFRDLGVRLEQMGKTWLPFVLQEGMGWIGPLLGGERLRVTDLLGRLTANAPQFPAESGPVVALGRWVEPAPEELAWMVSRALVELAHCVNGEATPIQSHQVELDPSTLETRNHLVLPIPKETEDPAALGSVLPQASPALTPSDLIDSRTGVITEVRRISHHPSIPGDLVTVHAHVSKLSRVTPWKTDPVAAGSTFGSEEQATAAAVGEAVERYAGNIIRKDLLREATWSEITAGREEALDPQELVLFSERQHRAPGFPFAPFTRSLRTYWVEGECLSDGKRAWLPASLVYPNWNSSEFAGSPYTNNTFYPGIAAGPSLDFARASGIEEIIERHATMVWWAHAQPLPAVAAPKGLIDYAGREAGGERQRRWLIPIDNEFGVPVMAGVVEDIVDRILTVGFAARATPREAALKAWAEAFTLQDGARDLDDPRGGYRQSAARGEVLTTWTKPWREDRRYLDAYRGDFHDMGDLMCQLQVYLDPRAADQVRPILETEESRDFAELPSLPDRSLRTYQSLVEARGYRVYSIDLTTPDVAATGMAVARVLVPGLVPNYAAAFPFLGRGCLQRAAVELGWRDTELDESEIHLFPLPHA